MIVKLTNGPKVKITLAKEKSGDISINAQLVGEDKPLICIALLSTDGNLVRIGYAHPSGLKVNEKDQVRIFAPLSGEYF
jgi:hypothetical protein